MKHEDKKSLEHLVILHNTQARMTLDLARQLEPYLPISSLDTVALKLEEVVVDKHRLPLKMFAPHIGQDTFPIESIEDLVRKLSDGVRSAIALAHAPNFPITNPVVRQMLATSLQGETGLRAAVPVAYYKGPSRLEPSKNQGE